MSSASSTAGAAIVALALLGLAGVALVALVHDEPEGIEETQECADLRREMAPNCDDGGPFGYGALVAIATLSAVVVWGSRA